jgi:hypothetical protein
MRHVFGRFAFPTPWPPGPFVQDASTRWCFDCGRSVSASRHEVGLPYIYKKRNVPVGDVSAGPEVWHRMCVCCFADYVENYWMLRNEPLHRHQVEGAVIHSLQYSFQLPTIWPSKLFEENPRRCSDCWNPLHAGGLPGVPYAYELIDADEDAPDREGTWDKVCLLCFTRFAVRYCEPCAPGDSAPFGPYGPCTPGHLRLC